MMMSGNRVKDAANRLAGHEVAVEKKPPVRGREMRNAVARLTGHKPEQEPSAPTKTERLDAIELTQRRIQKQQEARVHLERFGGVAGAVARLTGHEKPLQEGDRDE